MGMGGNAMRPSSNRRWMFSFLAVAGLPVVACMPGATGAGTGKKEAPAKVEPDTEPGLSRVTLTEKAAQRLGIQMASVREEQIVRKRTVGGEVAALRPGAALPAAPRPGAIPGPGASTVGVADLSGLVVRVRLNESDLETVDRGQPARVLPIDRQSS